MKHLCAILIKEQEISALNPLVSRLLTVDRSSLVAAGYKPSSGLFHKKASHWRKSNGSESFHIVVHNDGEARIHRDGWHPTKHPIRHILEICNGIAARPNLAWKLFWGGRENI